MNNNHVIYIEENEIKAKTIIKTDDFVAFVESLPTDSILFKDGVVTTDSLSEEQKELFNILFKSLKKQWNITQVLTATLPEAQVVKEAGVDLVIEDKPKKKRTRKKKEQTNG